MKKVLILAVAIVMSASLASAQSGGHIGIYSDDPGWSDCNLNETLYANNFVYVVHSLAPEGNTAQFMVQNNWPGPIVGAEDYGSNLKLGGAYTGVVVTYVGCKPLPHLLVTLAFIPTVASGPCGGTLEIVPDPALAAGVVEVVDCSSNKLVATGGVLSINGTPEDCPCQPDATEQTTWGNLKALYR